MPVPKRWFPCSRDINEDAEVWELSNRHGVTGLRMLLEVWAIVDKTENCWHLTGDYVGALAHKVGSHRKKVERVLQFMEQKNWITIEVSPGNHRICRARNYGKYRRSREPKQHGIGSPPILDLTSLDLTTPKEKKETPHPDCASPNNGSRGPRRGSPPLLREGRESAQEYVKRLGERMTMPAPQPE